MNHFYTDELEIINWLEKMDIKNYSINDDLSVTVDDDVIISNSELKVIPVKFYYINGDFDCSYNKIISLDEVINSVAFSINCSNNELVSLKGIPKKIGGYFDCSFNKLKSLRHSPNEIGGEFSCIGNQITSLLHGPDIVGADYYCSKNKIASLEGSPKKINGHFECHSNELLNLYHAPLSIDDNLDISFNFVDSFRGIDINMNVGGDIKCDFANGLDDSDKLFKQEKQRLENLDLIKTVKSHMKQKPLQSKTRFSL